MDIKDIYNLYKNGDINIADFKKLSLLYEDAKLTSEEATNKENAYFNNFKSIISTLSENEEKARVLFEIRNTYTQLKASGDIDEATNKNFSSIYKLVNMTPDNSTLLSKACDMAKKELIKQCLFYQMKTGFITTNKDVFYDILSKTYKNDYEKDILDDDNSRSATR